MNTFTIVFLALLAAALVVQQWLDRRQIRHVRAGRHSVPAPFHDKIALDAHQKAADYTVVHTRLGAWESLYRALLLLGWTLGGGLALLDGAWRGLGLGPLATGVGVMASAFTLMVLLELPFSICGTFGVEQRFGFNRSTPRLFALDLLRQLLLLLLLGAPLAWLVLWLMGHAGALWWLYAWAVWMAFTLTMTWAYPAFIAPLFNRFTSLDDGALRRRIEALLERCGFSSRGIYVMDGSRRSSHGNAYFTGLGRHKRIVFFDTLLEGLSHDEVEAVLAHELGHFRLRHVSKHILYMAFLSLAGLALLAWLMRQPWFFTGLGVQRPSDYMALLLFILVSPVAGFFLQPLAAAVSRRHEFEADDFAAQQADAGALLRALVKLYQENASTLTPDRLYSAFHDSHPPAPVRVAHLSAKMG